jgi:hypothetical protein
MGKWLAAGSVALLALLALLWRELRAPAEAAAAPPAPVASAPAATSAPATSPSSTAVGEVAKVGRADKLDPQSDEFFYHFDDLQPSMLTRNAAGCYTGGLHRVHRNQKVKLAFRDRIKDGVVTVEDVKVVESTIDDPALVACFVKEVQNTKWKDDVLPDWVQDDQLVIRPERGMKKYTRENMDYEGSGPDFTKR